MSHDVVVVGAGIFGAAGALELARRGRSVALLDRGAVPHPDAASTDISKVIRLEYGSDAFYMDRMEEALRGWRALNERWPRPLFHETGFAILTSEPMAEGSFELESFELLASRGHPVERLEADEVVRRFPAWRPGAFVDGYYNQLGGWAESGEVVARFVEEAVAAGVELRPGARVAALLEEGDAVRGVRTEAGEIRAGHVVLACGAWTGVLVPELAEAMRPVGQPVLHFRPASIADFEAPRFVPWAADISRTGWYGFCAAAGDVVKVANHGPGALTDPDGARPLPEGAEARFREFFRGALPGLADAPRVGSRLCLYCDSFDGDPWIAAHPGRPGLVVASGGSGHGFKLAPLLGEAIADAVEGRPRWPERFGWRDVSSRRFEEARYSGEG